MRILKQWIELTTHFQIARSHERCYIADFLYSMLDDKENLAFLLFLKSILGEVQAVNKNIEAEMHDPTQVLKDLVLLVDSLGSKMVAPGKKI